jgi:hypothetical protein
LAEAELAQIKYWNDPTLFRFTDLCRSRIGSRNKAATSS